LDAADEVEVVKMMSQDGKEEGIMVLNYKKVSEANCRSLTSTNL
jgi:hypothetical protein